MIGIGPTEGIMLVAMLVIWSIPLAIVVWLIVSIQAIKKSLKNIESSLADASDSR